MNTREFFPLSEFGARGVDTLCRVTYGATHPPFDEHDHGDCFETVFFMSGEQTYEINGSPVTLNGGEFLLSQPGEKHRTEMHGEEISDFYYMIFHFKTDNFLHFDKNATEYIASRFYSCKEKKHKQSARMKQILHRLFKIKKERSALAKIQFEIYLPELFLEMVLCLENSQKPVFSDMQKLVETIRCAPQKEYTIEILAKSVGLSPSRLKQKFKEYTGIPVMKFIMKQKIEKAQEMLLDPSISITDIAFELNFCSSQHFSSVFKKYSRLSPKQYRLTPRQNIGPFGS